MRLVNARRSSMRRGVGGLLEIGACREHGIEARCGTGHQTGILHAFVVVPECLEGVAYRHHAELALDGDRVVDAALAEEEALPYRNRPSQGAIWCDPTSNASLRTSVGRWT